MRSGVSLFNSQVTRRAREASCFSSLVISFSCSFVLSPAADARPTALGGAAKAPRRPAEVSPLALPTSSPSANPSDRSSNATARPPFGCDSRVQALEDRRRACEEECRALEVEIASRVRGRATHRAAATINADSRGALSLRRVLL